LLNILFSDPYHILHADEGAVVTSIMQSLLQKQVVKDEFMQDLGFDSTRKKLPDPRMKMNVRHQQACVILVEHQFVVAP